jgi:hypothetical protein
MVTRISTITVIALIVFGSIFTGVARAETAQEEITVTPVRDITPQEVQIISRAAAKVLRHIADARASIKENKPEQAQKFLEQCQRLITIIKDTVPIAKVKDHIWVAKKHLDYEETEQVQQDFVPIYASLDEIAYMVPVEKVREHLDKAKKSLENKDKTAAKQQLEQAEKSLEYVEVDLPLNFTQEHVQAAQNYLKAKENKKAEEALKAAEDGVEFISVDMYSPIILARHNILKAMENYAAGSFAEARKDLATAKHNLKKEISGMDEKLKKEAEKLVSDITVLEKELKSGGRDIKADLKQLWDKINLASAQRMVMDKFRKQGKE